jgi:hypothetical protein
LLDCAKDVAETKNRKARSTTVVRRRDLEARGNTDAFMASLVAKDFLY